MFVSIFCFSNFETTSNFSFTFPLLYNLFSHVSQVSENKESKQRKVCRCGAGVKATPNMCDTSGFPLRTEPKLVHDLRGFDRLELPCNNQRIVASSKWLLQGWRANCNIQVLLYNCNPLHPNPDEIAWVTDYIVAYACKGNETIVEEKRQMKALIMSCQDNSGTSNDVKRIARKLLNRTTKNKIISKQECMCHLAKLPLFSCSESIETVSLSGEYRLCTLGESKSSFITKYAKRDTTYSKSMSLHQYFHYIKNSVNLHKIIIPHYVGARSIPIYPPTEGYAKSMLLLYMPWENKFIEQTEPKNYIAEFHSLLQSPVCPMSVKIGYERAKARYEENKQFVEPTGNNENICYELFSTTADESVKEIVTLASTLGLTCNKEITEDDEYFYGDDLTDWSKVYHKVCFM